MISKKRKKLILSEIQDCFHEKIFIDKKFVNAPDMWDRETKEEFDFYSDLENLVINRVDSLISKWQKEHNHEK